MSGGHTKQRRLETSRVNYKNNESSNKNERKIFLDLKISLRFDIFERRYTLWKITVPQKWSCGKFPIFENVVIEADVFEKSISWYNSLSHDNFFGLYYSTALFTDFNF